MAHLGRGECVMFFQMICCTIPITKVSQSECAHLYKTTAQTWRLRITNSPLPPSGSTGADGRRAFEGREDIIHSFPLPTFPQLDLIFEPLTLLRQALPLNYLGCPFNNIQQPCFFFFLLLLLFFVLKLPSQMISNASIQWPTYAIKTNTHFCLGGRFNLALSL